MSHHKMLPQTECYLTLVQLGRNQWWRYLLGAVVILFFWLVLVANYEGSVLKTESIFTARELDPLYTLITLIGGGLVFYWLFFGRHRRFHR